MSACPSNGPRLVAGFISTFGPVARAFAAPPRTHRTKLLIRITSPCGPRPRGNLDASMLYLLKPSLRVTPFGLVGGQSRRPALLRGIFLTCHDRHVTNFQTLGGRHEQGRIESRQASAAGWCHVVPVHRPTGMDFFDKSL